MTSLAKSRGVTRDFLARDFVPPKCGYRVVVNSPAPGAASAADPDLPPAFDGRGRVIHGLKARRYGSTRLIFQGANRFGLIIAGPGGFAKIPHAHSQILLTLCGRRAGGVAGWEMLSESVWPDPDHMPDYWKDILGIHVYRLRKILKSIGSELAIANVWGRGYQIMRHPARGENDNCGKGVAAA